MRESPCVALEPLIRRWALRQWKPKLPQTLTERLRSLLENIKGNYASPMNPVSLSALGDTYSSLIYNVYLMIPYPKGARSQD